MKHQNQMGLKATDLTNAVNIPDPQRPGMRIIGWRVPVEKAGLSDALFFLERLLEERHPIAPKGDELGEVTSAELYCKAREAFDEEHKDSLVDLTLASKLSLNHGMPYADGETTLRWWGFESGYERGWQDRAIHTNTIESFWAIVKRSIYGQFHHVSKKYMHLYLNEISYRYNQRNQDKPWGLEGILCLAVKP